VKDATNTGIRVSSNYSTYILTDFFYTKKEHNRLHRLTRIILNAKNVQGMNFPRVL